MSWTEWLINALTRLSSLRGELSDRATSPGKSSSLGKRQSLFEEKAVELILDILPAQTIIEAEGYSAFEVKDAEWVIELDPTDGTAGDARLGEINSLVRGLPVTCVISVRKNVSNPTFESVRYAGILNLRDNQMFLANESEAFTFDSQKNRVTLHPTKQYNIHAPAIATEAARRANAFLRYLIPYGIYPEVFADSHSSAMVMLWSLLGYGDLYFNAELPGIEGAGQRGHELGAIAVFARVLNSYAVRTTTTENQIIIVGLLDEAPYTFDGQTSVIVGVDERIVDHYLSYINAGLKRQITFSTDRGKLSLSAAKVLAEMYRQYPDERWELPLVGEGEE